MDKVAGLKEALGRARAFLDANHPVRALQQLDILLAEHTDNEEAIELRYEALLFCAIDELNEGRIVRAEKLVRMILVSAPSHVPALRLLASIATRLEIFADSEALLRRALGISPDYHEARFELAHVLQNRKKYDESLIQIDTLLESSPENIEFRILKGMVLARSGNFDAAVEHNEDLLKQNPNRARVYLNHGHSLKTIGEQERAIDAYNKALKLQPELGEPWWSLANLKTFEFSNKDIDKMVKADKAGSGDFSDHYHRYFALGKGYADKGQAKRSMEFYIAGNAGKRKEGRYSAEETTRMCDKLIEVCTPELFKEKQGLGCEDKAPIFIVGLPRSGSTLLEQILSSHSMVDGTMELTDIISLARRLSGKKYYSDPSKYPSILNVVGGENLRKLGEEYISATRGLRGDAPYFTDKMPNNFSHIGLIKLILPNAKIIDARRNPLDACFSGFRQLFAKGQEFTYDLTDIGLYYRDYVRLMDHYDSVLPGEILRVKYEDVVSDLDQQVARILEFCDLPFESNCLEFFNTKRAIRTASSEQVRKPIYTSGMNQWEDFGPYLDELRSALGEELVELSLSLSRIQT